MMDKMHETYETKVQEKVQKDREEVVVPREVAI